MVKPLHAQIASITLERRFSRTGATRTR
jgi:hypothetical protein